MKVHTYSVTAESILSSHLLCISHLPPCLHSSCDSNFVRVAIPSTPKLNLIRHTTVTGFSAGFVCVVIMSCMGKEANASRKRRKCSNSVAWWIGPSPTRPSAYSRGCMKSSSRSANVSVVKLQYNTKERCVKFLETWESFICVFS